MENDAQLLLPPPWGMAGNRASIGVAYLASSLLAEGLDAKVVDISRRVREEERELHHQLEEATPPHQSGGVFMPPIELLLQALSPDPWGDRCSELAWQVHRSAEATASSITVPGGLHGMTLLDTSVPYGFCLGAAIRRRGGRVVMGGVALMHPPTAELALRLGAADAVVVGDGETALVALARAQRDGLWSDLPLNGHPGLSLKIGDEVVRTEAAPRPRHLPPLPHPDWRGQELPEFFVNVLASRGCVGRCSFCSERASSPGYGLRAVTDVVEELDHLCALFGKSHFEFNDDLLNGDVRWLRTFCRTLEERRSPYQWQGLCRPRGMTPQLLETMQRAGCTKLSFGVQHFSPRMLEIMGRKQYAARILEVLEHALGLGLEVHIDLLVGHPGERDEDVELNLEAVNGLRSRHERFQVFQNPFHLIWGAPVFSRPKRFGVEVERYSSALPTELERYEQLVRQFVVGFRSDVTPDQIAARMELIDG